MRSKPSFDLEKALTARRRSLQHRKALTDDDRDDLAQHIRDQVQALMIGRLSEEAAYRQALREMGQGYVIETEYRTLKKNKVSSVINVFGPSMAIAVCIAHGIGEVAVGIGVHE